jgi:hypothetical protein
MAEEIRNKFVSWTLNVVKEIKEIPAKKSSPHPSPTSAAAAATTLATTEVEDAPAFPDLTTAKTTSNTKKSNEIYGVGVNLAFVQPPSSSSSTPRVGVHSLEPTGPANKAGLQPGDIILSANSIIFHSNKYYLPDDVAAAIRGPEGSHVKLVVERNGTKLEFDVIRAPIGMRMISGMMMPKSTNNTTSTSCISDPSAAPFAMDVGETKSTEDESTKNKATESPTTTNASNNPDKQTKNALLATLHSLSLSEDEHKDNDKELTSSLEDEDQFDDDIKAVAITVPSTSSRRSSSISLNMDASDASDAASSSEAKTNDDNDNHSTTIEDDHSTSTSTNQQWEMLSERSGSTAILISFSGSMSNASYSSFHNRSPSPSVLKNKFVLTESNGDAYIYHVVLPTDTLQGLCLAYKLSATRLRMENNFSGNSLQLAPKKLRIPNNIVAKSSSNTSSSASKGSGNNKGMMIRVQDTTSKEYKLYAFVAEIPTMELVEAKAYLDLSNWDLEEALRSAREDEGWSLRNNYDGDGVSFEQQATLLSIPAPLMNASTKPKALTAHDIYSGMPPYDGDGFELSDIKQR